MQVSSEHMTLFSSSPVELFVMMLVSILRLVLMLSLKLSVVRELLLKL